MSSKPNRQLTGSHLASPDFLHLTAGLAHVAQSTCVVSDRRCCTSHGQCVSHRSAWPPRDVLATIHASPSRCGHEALGQPTQAVA